MSVDLEQEYPAEIIWSCAAAADRINGGYCKDSLWLPNEKTSNKAMVFRFLEQWRNNQLDTVTDEDVSAGKLAREYWQNQMLILLDDSANQYLKAVVNASHLNTIDSMLDISVIASSISAVSREKHRAEIKEKKQSVNSQWSGSVGETITFDKDIEIISCKFIDKFDSNIVECIIEDNLYMWWSSKKLEPGMYSQLKGRVKTHKKDLDTGQPITQLNYVKATQ